LTIFSEVALYFLKWAEVPSRSWLELMVA